MGTSQRPSRLSVRHRRFKYVNGRGARNLPTQNWSIAHPLFVFEIHPRHSFAAITRKGLRYEQPLLSTTRRADVAVGFGQGTEPPTGHGHRAVPDGCAAVQE